MVTLTHYLKFNGFMCSYKYWVYHGETIHMPTSSNLNSSRTSTINVNREISNHVDTTKLLNDIFKNVQQQNVEYDDVSYDFDMGDPIEGEDNDIGNDSYFINGVSEGDYYKDAGYSRVKKLADEVLYSGSSYSKLSFILHLFH